MTYWFQSTRWKYLLDYLPNKNISYVHRTLSPSQIVKPTCILLLFFMNENIDFKIIYCIILGTLKTMKIYEFLAFPYCWDMWRFKSFHIKLVMKHFLHSRLWLIENGVLVSVGNILDMVVTYYRLKERNRNIQYQYFHC